MSKISEVEFGMMWHDGSKLVEQALTNAFNYFTGKYGLITRIVVSSKYTWPDDGQDWKGIPVSKSDEISANLIMVYGNGTQPLTNEE